jgi:general secretion pathway protein E
LRQNPNVILVGEIRDRETAEIAIQAALTGHLVLSTLHTNSAASAVTRLRDMGIDDYLIGATVKGVVAQRLLRKPCACAHGTGECAKCGGTGYSGRTVTYEIAEMNSNISRKINSKFPEDLLAAAFVEQGTTPIDEHARALAKRGVTSEAEIIRVINLGGGA